MNHRADAGLLAIGMLAQRSGLNVSAIRYYEEIGLIPQAVRRPSGHRAYGTDVEDTLTLIRHCRDFGFSIEEIRALVSLSASDERDCVEARDIAQKHLDAVRTRLVELKTLERSLSRYVKACTDQCAGGPALKCTILKDLGATQPAVPGCCG